MAGSSSVSSVERGAPIARRRSISWLIGLMWLAMTVLSECLFGRLAARKSWPELLQAYDISSGNLWLLELVVFTLSPFLVAKQREAAARVTLPPVAQTEDGKECGVV